MKKAIYDEMLSYHNGYILALEDVLEDYKRLISSGAFTGQSLILKVRGSLDDAKRSRETFVFQNEVSE